MANEFKVKKGLIVVGSGSATPIVDVQGSQGQLFSITDSLSGSLFSANDISGIPVIEAFSDTTVKIGQFNAEAIIASGSEVRMGNRASNIHSITGSLRVTGSTSINGTTTVTGSLLVSGSVTSTGTLTAQTLVVQTVSSSIIYSSGSNTFGNSLANNQVLTGSVIVTGSLSVNGSNVVLVNQTSSFATFTALNAYTSSINSYTSSLNSRTSSFATTGSNTFTGNQTINGLTVITGSLAVGTGSIGVGENTLTVGPAPNGGLGEGGQILLSAAGGAFNSASMLDNYQNRFRVLKGTNSGGSDSYRLQVDLHSGQIQIPTYTGSGAFAGTAAANLAVDSSGNVITVAPGGGGGGGTTDTGSLATTGSNLFRGDQRISGSLTVTSSIYQGAFGSNETQLTGYGLVVQGANSRLRVGPNYSTGGDRDYIDLIAGGLESKLTTNNENFIIENRESGYNISLVTSGSGNVNITGSLRTTGSVNITGPNSGTTPLIAISATGTGTFQRGVRLLNSGMNAGDHIMYAVGQADSARNMGQFYFQYNGAGSTSNRISMGLHSVDDVFNILGSGNIGINKTTANASLDLLGNALISGSLTVFTGSGVEFQVTNTGVRMGNIVGDIHTVTGSLIVSGSTLSQNGSNVVLTNQTSSMSVASAASASNITNAITNAADNRVLTANGGGTINGEANLTYNGSTLQISNEGTFNTTTPGTGLYGLHFTGQNTADYANGLTWNGGSSGAQAGIYVQGSGAYGTRMFFGTTDAYVSGAKTAMSINETGIVTITRNYLQSNTDLRAPIFYDSADTAYYINANSTSNIYQLRAGGGNASPASTTFTHTLAAVGGSSRVVNFDGNGSGPSVWWTNGSSAVGAIDGIVGGGLGLWVNNGSSWQQQAQLNYGNVTILTDIRSPIFYDSADTGYYVNANNISSLYGVAIRGDNSQFDSINQIFFWGAGDTTTSAIGFKANGGEFSNPTTSGDGYNTYLTMDTPGRGWVFREGTGGTNFNAVYTSGWILNNGIWQANASMRAPIFYDSNNTGYYVDPASTSNVNYINANRVVINSSNSTYIEGDTAGISVAGSGYLYVPASGGMYIQGILRVRNYLENDASTYLDVKGGTSNHTYFRGNIGIGVTGPSHAVHASGTIFGTSDVRSPIFYDSANTAYYFDGSATGDSIRVAGDVVAYYSDERLKDIKGNITNALEKILSLDGFYYEANELAQSLGYEKKPEVGLSAQQVEAILPEIIKSAPINHNYKTLNYGRLMPLVVEAFKEQQTIITSQQQQIDELKELVNKLLNK